MPLYDYRCTRPCCEQVQEGYRSYDKRDDAPACACGCTTVRVFLPPQVMRDITDAARIHPRRDAQPVEPHEIRGDMA